MDPFLALEKEHESMTKMKYIDSLENMRLTLGILWETAENVYLRTLLQVYEIGAHF